MGRQLVTQGAEGRVYIADWLGHSVIIKESPHTRRAVWRLHRVLTLCAAAVVFNAFVTGAWHAASGMSYCKQEGKDRVIFVTEEDHSGPSEVSLPEDDDTPAGLIQPDGEINWACPCLGGMATGPCGVEFREAFSCFHYSTAEPKGSDCLEPFRQMSECMAQYPNVYGNKEDKDEVPATNGDLSDGAQTSGEVAAKA